MNIKFFIITASAVLVIFAITANVQAGDLSGFSGGSGGHYGGGQAGHGGHGNGCGGDNGEEPPIVEPPTPAVTVLGAGSPAPHIDACLIQGYGPVNAYGSYLQALGYAGDPDKIWDRSYQTIDGIQRQVFCATKKPAPTDS